MTKGFAKSVSQHSAMLALLALIAIPQVQAASLDDILKTYSGAFSNVASGNQASKVGQSLYYHAVNGSGECAGAGANHTGSGMSGCTQGKDGTYSNYILNKDNCYYGNCEKIYNQVVVDYGSEQVKKFLQNMYKSPPGEGAPGYAHYGNFDAFVAGNKFTAAEATEMVGWIYGENMAAAYAKNLAEQGISGNKVLANMIYNNGKPGGLQTFYGVLDKVDNMGAMMEDQIKDKIQGTVKTEVKNLLLNAMLNEENNYLGASVEYMNKLDKLSVPQLQELAKKTLGIDMNTMTASALDKVSGQLGFDVNNLSGASIDQLKSMGVSDLALKQFEAGILNNYKNLAMYGLEGAENMWNFDTNALFDTVNLDTNFLKDLAADELAAGLGVEDLGDLKGLTGEDLSAVLGEKVNLEMLDKSAFEAFASSGSGSGGGGSWGGGSSYSGGSGSGWIIM